MRSATLLVLSFAAAAHAQPGKRFVAEFAPTAPPAAPRAAGAGLVVGRDAAIFAAGRLWSSAPGESWRLIKYSPFGATLWTRGPFSCPDDDAEWTAALALDLHGDLLVAWNSADAPILKLDGATGATRWTAPFPAWGPGRSGPAALAVGPDGDAYITGQGAPDADQDWITARLDGATGAARWTARENGTFGGPDGINDGALGIALAPDGSVLVAGSLQVGDAPEDEHGLFSPAVVKYDADGARLWRTILPDVSDRGAGLRVLVAPDGDALVVANLADAIMTARLGADDGALRWTRTWAGPADAGALSLDAKLDAAGDLLLAGSACDGAPWCDAGPVVRKVRSADGAELWSTLFNDPDSPDRYGGAARSLAVTADGTVLAAGLMAYGLFGYDRKGALLALDPADGALRWRELFLPPDASSASFAAVASDPGGDPVIVGARASRSAASMLTIRYGCAADFTADGFVDFFDYDAFVACFEGAGCPPDRSADFNGDGFADFFDYDDFVTAFETGC